MCKFLKILNVVLLFILLIVSIKLVKVEVNNDININTIYKDSIEYNIIKKDSIEYNIIKKDSTIVEIKKQFENEKDNIINMSDSTIIDLFTKLANE